VTGRQLYDLVVDRWPMEDNTFASGYFIRSGEGLEVRFLRYRNAGGIVEEVSPRTMAKVAPKMMAALRANGAQLKSFVLSCLPWGEAPGAPRGVGSSELAALPHRTPGGAHGCECNADDRSDYAQNGGGAGVGRTAGDRAADGARAVQGRGVGGFRANVAPAGAKEEGEGAL